MNSELRKKGNRKKPSNRAKSNHRKQQLRPDYITADEYPIRYENYK